MNRFSGDGRSDTVSPREWKVCECSGEKWKVCGVAVVSTVPPESDRRGKHWEDCLVSSTHKLHKLQTWTSRGRDVGEVIGHDGNE